MSLYQVSVPMADPMADPMDVDYAVHHQYKPMDWKFNPGQSIEHIRDVMTVLKDSRLSDNQVMHMLLHLPLRGFEAIDDLLDNMTPRPIQQFTCPQVHGFVSANSRAGDIAEQAALSAMDFHCCLACGDYQCHSEPFDPDEPCCDIFCRNCGRRSEVKAQKVSDPRNPGNIVWRMNNTVFVVMMVYLANLACGNQNDRFRELLMDDMVVMLYRNHRELVQSVQRNSGIFMIRYKFDDLCEKLQSGGEQAFMHLWKNMVQRPDERTGRWGISLPIGKVEEM